MAKVNDYFSSVVYAAHPADTIASARNTMLSKGVSRIVVVEAETPIGTVTRKDIMKALKRKDAPWKSRPVDEIPLGRIMNRKLVKISSKISIEKAAKLMLEKNISSLIVEDADNVGIITKTDIARAYLDGYKGRFRVLDLMEKNIATANRFHSINHVVKLIEKSDAGSVVIVDRKKPAGIITPTDLSFADLRKAGSEMRSKKVTYTRKPSRGARPRYRYVKKLALLTAEDLMSKNLLTIDGASDAANAARIMLDSGISSLPVVENDALVGIITKTNFVEGIAKGGAK